MARNVDLANLHPIVREKVQSLIKKLANENIPLRLFEGYRFPSRQHQLYSQGRTRPGNIVTKADAWMSYHQYGVACDFVVFENGKWSWQTSGKYKKYWARYQELGAEVGLKPISWEKPHLELHGLSLQALRNGDYPKEGDESWAENLSTCINNWTASPAPPLPIVHFERPALPPEALDENDILSNSLNTISTHITSYRVNARNGLRMRAGPGTEFDIISTLLPNQRVHVSQKQGQWYQVDLQKDGLADGYCFAGFLSKVI